jgi:hypothetical protein
MFDLHEHRRSLTASTFLYRDSDIRLVEARAARHGAAAQSPTSHLPSKFILLAVEAHLCVDMSRSARKERARLIFLPFSAHETLNPNSCHAIIVWQLKFVSHFSKKDYISNLDGLSDKAVLSRDCHL